MTIRLLTLLNLVFFATGLQAQDSLPAAAPPYFRVRYEPSVKPGELPFGVSYTVWIPPGVKTLRGIVVHQHGCGEGACKAGQTAAFDLHWQALARRHECALLGPSYEQPEKADCQLWCDPRNGSESKYFQALGELAELSQHPELKSVPWALWGHSGGATWVGTMLMRHPERIVAVWLRSGAPPLAPREGSKLSALVVPPAAYGVPVMSNLGTKEGVTDKEGRFAKVYIGTEQFFKAFRAKGGLIAVSVDPGSSHDCGNSRYLAMPWFDACLTLRLPDQVGSPLKPMPTTNAWLAPLLGETARPAAQFTGDVLGAVWLPNQSLATAWMEYTKNGNVSDSTPPTAPVHVKQTAGNKLRWEAEADLESGIAAFIIERDGIEIGRVPAKPRGSIGRQVFQNIGYSDTPTPPLAEMEYTDTAAQPDAKHEYRVITVNSVGLKSEAATAAE